MSLLKNTLPAERARGCKWADRFTSIPDIIKNGGTISGTPTIQPGGGIVLNGSTDWIDYANHSSSKELSDFTIVIDIAPDIAFDDNLQPVLLALRDPSGTEQLRIQKWNNAGGNQFGVVYDGPRYITVAAAQYSSYWVLNQRVVIVVVCRSSGSGGKVYFNGNTMTIAQQSFTPFVLGSLSIGDRYGGVSTNMAGLYSEVKIFDAVLTQAEAQAYYDNSMWNYRNRAVIDLPMLAQDHDPSNLGDDVLNNGDFESGFTAGVANGWDKYQTVDCAYSEGVGRVGGSSQRVVSEAASIIHAGIRQTISPSIAGKRVKFSGWVKTDDITGGPVLEFTLSDFSLTTLSVVADTWTYFEYFVTSSGASIVYLHHNGLSLGSYVEYDDVKVEEVRSRTLDVSGNANHALLGTATPSTQPSKLQRRGYDVGSGDYMNCGDVTGLNGAAKFTLARMGRFSFLSTGTVMSKYLDASNFLNIIVVITPSLWIQSNILGTTHTNQYDGAPAVLNDGGVHSLIIAFDLTKSAAADKISLYVDGQLIAASTNGITETAIANLTGAPYDPAGRAGVSPSMLAEQYQHSVWLSCLNPTQVHDLHASLMRTLRKVA